MHAFTRSLLLLVLFFVTAKAYGQGATIQGKVVDEKGQPVDYGNVLALRIGDSVMVKGTYIMNGRFELSGIDEMPVILLFTTFAYEQQYYNQPLQADKNGVVDIGTVTLTTRLLKTVEITGNIPLYVKEIDKLVVNVDGTILSEKGTALDVLKSSPNVIVKSDGQVVVPGKGTAIVYVDGQRVATTDILNAIGSRDVKKINIIENPGPKYDAQGNAVIEIITKKSELEGYQGSVYALVNRKTFWSTQVGGNINYKNKKWSLFYGMGNANGTYRTEDTYYRKIAQPSVVEMDNRIVTDVSHDLELANLLKAEYRIDTLNTLFFNYYGVVNDWSSTSTNINNIYENGLFSGDISSHSTGQPASSGHSFTGGYSLMLDTLESELKFTGQYTFHDIRNVDVIDQQIDFGTPANGLLQSRSTNRYNILSGQMDFGNALNKNHKLDVGCKAGIVSNESGIDFQEKQHGTWVVDSVLLNSYAYEEKTLALFGQLSGVVKKWQYMLGARSEWTVSNGRSEVMKKTVVDTGYIHLFPNARLGYQLSEDLLISLTYLSRINRPAFKDLDPFVNYIDTLSSFRGNPGLKPSVSKQSELSVDYAGIATFSLGYTRSEDPMYLTVEKLPTENSFAAVVRNLKASETYSVGTILSFEIGKWSTYNSFTYAKNSFVYNEGVSIVENTRPMLFLSLYNEFNVFKDASLELTYEYVSPGADGLFVLRPYQSLGAGISAKFFKRKLVAKFTGFDLTYREIESGTTQLNDFYVDYSSKTDTRTWRCMLTWNFGKLKDTKIKDETLEGDFDRIKKN